MPLRFSKNIFFLTLVFYSCVGSKNKRLTFHKEEVPTIIAPGEANATNFQNATLAISKVVNGGDKWYIYLHLIGADGKHLNGLTGDILDISYSRIVKRFPIDTHNVHRLKVENIWEQGCNPMSLMFSIDRSGSMRRNAEKTRAAAKNFVNAKMDEDEIGIIVFGSWAKRESELSTNKDRLLRRLDEIDLTRLSGTNFNEGIDKALNNVKYQAHLEDKEILLLSDGYGMSVGQANKLINKARNLGIAINFFQYKPFDERTRRELKLKDDGKLAERMANSTGGIYKTIGFDNDFTKEFMDLRYKACNVYKVTIDKPDVSGDYMYTFKMKSNYVQKRLDFGIKYTYSDLTFFHSKNMGNKKLDIPAVIHRMDSLHNNNIVDDEPQVNDVFLLNVYFDFDKSNLKSSSDSALKEVYELMIKYPKLRIELRGHTDNKGTPDYNKKLSLDRCISVRAELEKMGISHGRIEVLGLGAEEPIASNSTEEGRKKNRRTEFKILQKD